MFEAGMVVTIALSKSGPTETREFVLAREPTRDALRADFIEVFFPVYMHFISEDMALLPVLGYHRYPGIHTFIGREVQ